MNAAVLPMKHCEKSAPSHIFYILPCLTKWVLPPHCAGMSLPISGLEKDDANMPGVGISGIRERVRQLGGQMQIRSGEWGTALEVFFPAESSSEAASSEAAGA